MPAIERQPDLFNYDALTPTTRDIVQRRTGEIKDLMRRTMSDIVDIGLKLVEVKDILAHGNFGIWLESEFGWSDRTARNYMQVARAFKSETVSDLIAPKALYILCNPDVPEAIRTELNERAKAGEKITPKIAQTRLAQHKDQFTPARPVMAIDAQRVTPPTYPPFDPETGEVLTAAPVFTGPEVVALIQPDPDHVIQKNEVEQALQQIGWDEASRLEGVLARAIAALTALSTYAPKDLASVASSGAGQQLQIPIRLSRVQQLCNDTLRLTVQDRRTVDA